MKIAKNKQKAGDRHHKQKLGSDEGLKMKIEYFTCGTILKRYFTKCMIFKSPTWTKRETKSERIHHDVGEKAQIEMC